MAHPETQFVIFPGQEHGQGQQLRVMKEPDTGLQVPAFNVFGHLLHALEIDCQFFLAQGPGRALQQIVDALGDLKELGIFGADHDALGRQTQGVHEGHQRLQDFRHAAAGSCAIGVDKAQPTELLRQAVQVVH